MRLLLLCNEPMRKRCQCLLTAAVATQRRRSLGLTARMKCITFVEYVDKDGKCAFSLSEKTDRQLACTNLVLCLLRVERFQPDAWGQLVVMLAARQTHFEPCKRAPGNVVLVQCCGSAYNMQSGLDCQRICTDPGLVDYHLRAWLAGNIGCPLDDLACMSVDNASAGKALRHRLFGRRYTVQVEFAEAAPYSRRRRSLYRLTAGREAADGGCSPPAVVKRRWSLDNGLDEDGGRGGNCSNLFQLDPKALEAGGVTLVICGSRSCAAEAALCLNNLTSRGHKAASLNAFAAASSALLTGSRARRSTAAQLGEVLARLSPTAASGAIFLLFCRGPGSRLLAEFLRRVAGSVAPMAAVPRAGFAVLLGPVSEAECQQLRGCGAAAAAAAVGCPVDAICCSDGLSGGRVLESLMPSLSAMMRQLEACRAGGMLRQQ